MAAQYSFVMKGLTKTFPGAPKPVLNGIHLQFYRDAKIGIVGPNGSGKSTLMKIMAGIDKEFSGEAWPGENITVGYLPQEPDRAPGEQLHEYLARRTGGLVELAIAAQEQARELTGRA